MIQLGQLSEQILNKEYPDNWKALATMMNLKFEEVGDEIDIEFPNDKVLTVRKDNSIATTASLEPKAIVQIIIDFAKQEQEQ